MVSTADMGRPLIDRVSDPVRRHLMTSLFYAPSLGALAIAGGLIPAAVATGMFTTFAAYSYMCLKLEKRDIMKFQEALPRHTRSEHRRSAPVKVQRMCNRLRREFGIEKPVRVYLYPDSYPPAFATPENEIGFSRKAYNLLSYGQLRWVLAHELAHIAKGDTKVNYPMLTVSNYMERVAAGIGAAATVQVMVNANLMVGGLAGLTAAFAVATARRYVDMYSSRSMERRRDYEATQKTGNPIDAIMAVTKVEALKGMDQISLHQQWLHTHPVGMKRVKNIVTAYQHGLRDGTMAPLSVEPAYSP